MTLAIRSLALALCCLAIPAFACDASDRIAGAGDRYILLAEGDSITYGIGSTDRRTSYVPRACVPKASGIETMVTAVGGAKLGAESDPPNLNTVFARMAMDNAMLAEKKRGRAAILSVLIGRNDLAGFEGGPAVYAERLAQYIHEMRAAGWDKIIVGTLLPSTSTTFTPARHQLNAILTAPGWAEAHGVDAIADFAALPAMGPDAAAARTDLYVDGTHPTDAGYAAMAPAYDGALKAVIGR